MIQRPELIPLTLNGALRRGGWQVSGQILGDTDLVARYDNWIIDGKSLADYVDPDWLIAFDGHISGHPDFSFTRYNSQANILAGTADVFLSGEHIQDISFAARSSPANSHEATSWDFGEIVTHILQHHTNYIFDAAGTNGSPDGWLTQTSIDTTNSYTFNPNEHFIVDASTNMWRTIQQIGGGEEGGGEFYRPYFDRNNKFYYQPAPPFQSLTSKGTITKDHIRGTARVQFHNSQPTDRVGQVKISAVATSTTIYNSTYPTNPDNGKIIEKTSGIWAHSQARTDTLAERLFKWLTREWTIQIEVDPGLILFGEDGKGLDIGQKVALTYNGPAEDTATGAGVHLNLSAAACFIYGIDIRVDTGRKSATAVLTLEEDNSA
jgi:hypothetical protein